MKLSTKIIAFAIAILFLLPLVVSCRQQTVQTEQTTVKTQDKDKEKVDILPELDYDGKDINIFTWTGTDEWVLEEEAKNASAIDYKSFEHISAVEDRLNVKFVIAKKESGGWGAHESFIATLNNTVSVQDGAYDLVCQYSLAASIGALRNVFSNLNEFEYFNDFKGEFWSDDLVNSNTIGGKIYYVTGDMTGTVVKLMGSIAYNKTLSEEYQFGDLYQVVRDGKWTLETLRTMVADIYTDKNNDDKRDAGDFYGLVVPQNNNVDYFQYGGDLRCIVQDSWGDWILNPDFTEYGEKAIDLSSELNRLLNHTTGAYFGYPTSSQDMFEKGQAIFQSVTGDKIIETISSSDVVYGILPMPKHDEAQEKYTTALGMTYSMFSIPKDAKNKEMSAAVMEAMGSSGYTLLTPYLFEVALKSRYAEDPQDAEMLDYIRSGIIYEPGRIFTTINCFALVRRSVQYDREWTAWYQEEGGSYRSELDNIIFELG